MVLRVRPSRALKRVVERHVERLGKDLRVRRQSIEVKALSHQRRERRRRVARPHVAMPLVGEPEEVTHRTHQAPPLGVRRVDHQLAAGAQDPVELGHATLIVRHVLEQVDHHHTIEGRVRERHPFALDAIDVATDQAPDRGDGLLGEIGARPVPASAAQEIADHPVVGAEVEAVLAMRIAEHTDDRMVLRLFKNRPIEEAKRPSLLGSGHGKRRLTSASSSLVRASLHLSSRAAIRAATSSAPPPGSPADPKPVRRNTTSASVTAISWRIE